MGTIAADLVPVALAVAFSPFPIIPVVLLLLTRRPLACGGSFLAGWFSGIVALAAAFSAVASAIELSDEVPTWAVWTRLVLGGVLIALGARKWIKGGRKSGTPGWMAALDEYTPPKAARLGFLLAVANPKVILLVLAGGVAIGAAELGLARSVVAILAFAVVAVSTVALPVVARLIGGERVAGPLDAARAWLVRHNDTIVAVVVIAIGLMLILKGAGVL